MADYNILVINPGSTSDEVSYFRGAAEVFHKTVRYSPEDLRPYERQKITAQFDLRRRMALEALKEHGVDLQEVQAVIGRGGLVKPIEGGVYEVDDVMMEDLREGVMGDHPSNLGGIIARDIAAVHGVKAFIADPVVVDELEPLARYSGMPENPRISIFHALNQKRVGRHAARQVGKPYEDCRLIIMHGGGGITVGAHAGGRVIDVNNGLDGDGPFTPQRSGGVPSGGLVKMCFSGNYTLAEMKLKLKGRGGLVAYTGTSDCLALEKYILTGEVKPGSGLDPARVSREQAREAVLAMAYQISKEIGAMAAVLEGKVDAIVLTGGLAYDKVLVPEIKRRVSWIAMVLTYPGGDEMTALRRSAEIALEYPVRVKKYSARHPRPASV
ncbi:MAG: butyrate kinase [Elusimicrobiales bacterium]|nr:butyrate kinase [Elusimicrobiales bacterium]